MTSQFTGQHYNQLSYTGQGPDVVFKEYNSHKTGNY